MIQLLVESIKDYAIIQEDTKKGKAEMELKTVAQEGRFEDEGWRPKGRCHRARPEDLCPFKMGLSNLCKD